MHPALFAARFRADDALASERTPETLAAAAKAGYRTFDDALANMADDIAADGPVACKAGCNWCCHQHVSVLAAEAIAVHAHVAGTQYAERLRAAIPAIVGKDSAARAAARLPCPFLDPGGCGIYPMRPNRCRAVHSRDAEYCRRRYEGVRGEPVPADKPIPVEPVRAADAVLAGLGQALRGRGLPVAALEFVHALAILEADPGAAAAYAAGEDVFAPARIAPPLAEPDGND